VLVVDGLEAPEQINAPLIGPHCMRAPTAGHFSGLNVDQMPALRLHIQKVNGSVVEIVAAVRLAILVRTTAEHKLTMRVEEERVYSLIQVTIPPKSNHFAVQDASGMEVSILRRLALGLQFGPSSTGEVEDVGLLRVSHLPLLIAAENVHAVCPHNGAVPVACGRVLALGRNE